MISPGRIGWPPPSSAASEIVQCGARTGRAVTRGRPSSRPATLWMAVTSIASSSVSGGRIDGRRRASIVLPEPGRSEQQHVVRAGGGDLEGALGMRLAAHVGEVAGRRRRAREQRRGVDRGRSTDALAAQVGDGLGERLDADDRRPAGERGLGGVADRHEQAGEPRVARGRGDRQGAAHGVNASVESELAEDAP